MSDALMPCPEAVALTDRFFDAMYDAIERGLELPPRDACGPRLLSALIAAGWTSLAELPEPAHRLDGPERPPEMGRLGG